jgi:catalase
LRQNQQVAFMTQHIPPGIDFSNDPLLQGRNSSYLDTQIKRLGSTNFTHLPINAPKCPFHHFQQDGHMAVRNPVGRVNYQPNSFGEGPRESPQRGFRSFAEVEEGPKQQLRLRASRTTTARRGSSSTARLRRSRSTSPRR